MKKIAIAILFLAGALTVNSCKKKECPKPEVWAPGNWKATELYNNGVLQSPSDPETACSLRDSFTFDEGGTGTAKTYSYSGGICSESTASVDWVENIDKHILIVTMNPPSGWSVKFTYENKDKFYIENDLHDKQVFERQ